MQQRFDFSEIQNLSDCTDPPTPRIMELVNLYENNELAKLMDQISSLLIYYPKSSILLNICGTAYSALNKFDLAIKLFEKSIDQKKNNPEAYNNLGIAYQKLEKHSLAIKSFEKALKYLPSFPEAHFNIGNSYRLLGKFKQAIEAYSKTIKIKPDFTLAYHNLGLVYQLKGDHEKAIKFYDRMSSICASFAESLYNWGIILQDKSDYVQAIDKYKEAVARDPNHLLAHLNLGNCEKAENNFDEAIKNYKLIIEKKPEMSVAYSNLADVQRLKGDYHSAIQNFYKAIDLELKSEKNNFVPPSQGPENNLINERNSTFSIADIYLNLGAVYEELNDLDSAIKNVKTALKIDPNLTKAHSNLRFYFYKKKKFGIALQHRVEANKSTNNGNKYSKHEEWHGIGSLFNKRLLVIGEQGPGDMIIWSSCLDYFQKNGCHITLACPEKLVKTFKRSFASIDVIPYDQNLLNKAKVFDFYVFMENLFAHYCDCCDSRHLVEKYVISDKEKVRKWSERLRSISEGPFIGISWKSPVMTQHRLPNYTSVEDWAPVFAQSKATFINLQSTNYKLDLDKFSAMYNKEVIDFPEIDQYDDLDEVAALVEALDATVSVATAVATLSAAVGTTTFIPTWRQSPWNSEIFTSRGPNVYKFCKDTQDSWHDVFGKISTELDKLS